MLSPACTLARRSWLAILPFNIKLQLKLINSWHLTVYMMKMNVFCDRSKHLHLHSSSSWTDGSSCWGEDSSLKEGLRKYAESCWLQTHAGLQDKKMFSLQQSTISARYLQVKLSFQLLVSLENCLNIFFRKVMVSKLYHWTKNLLI